MTEPKHKKVFFVSDFHLGADALLCTEAREKKIVSWLSEIEDELGELYLVGDVFDFWFEYGKVIPKGFSRILGKLAALRDKGIPVYFFTGNHDMWMFRYFEDELGIPIIRKPIIKEIFGKTFYIGHGDGLGPGDKGYKIIKTIFSNPVCQWLFSLLHPDAGIGLMKYFSSKSRKYTGDEAPFVDPSKEWLVQYCENYEAKDNIDYFIFGHRHLPVDYKLSNGVSRYVNLGEWLYVCSYGVWDGKEFHVKFYKSEHTKIYGM
ncbi:MAG: UDP-2,3-diacylglucosamine diphosphatase [Saprospiraceae bacterium]|nr:UDP-2,3-diacylglucosamine diphosphatase [Saprospiraceae bacterium]